VIVRPLGRESVTLKVAFGPTPLPSVTVTSPTEIVGAASSSMIVPVPTGSPI
jgi:hypothetical protein